MREGLIILMPQNGDHQLVRIRSHNSVYLHAPEVFFAQGHDRRQRLDNGPICTNGKVYCYGYDVRE